MAIGAGVARTEERTLPRPDFTTPRLYLDADWRVGGSAPLDADQAHYLFNVLRMAAGERVLVCNGREGEFAARLESAGKRGGRVLPLEQTRPQQAPSDLEYLFAPLKHARLDY